MASRSSGYAESPVERVPYPSSCCRSKTTVWSLAQVRTCSLERRLDYVPAGSTVSVEPEIGLASSASSILLHFVMLAVTRIDRYYD